MIGSSVRSLFQKGKGFPCFVSVEQDGTGSGLPIALALSRAIGATKAGAIASSAREETAMDLLAGMYAISWLIDTHPLCHVSCRTSTVAEYYYAFPVG
jgi:ketol-acid reductoisomerase